MAFPSSAQRAMLGGARMMFEAWTHASHGRVSE
jgi:hypothetical protein